MKLDIYIQEDVEPNNRGFIVYHLYIALNGVHAGYATFENIEEEYFHEHYPDSYEYAVKIAGVSRKDDDLTIEDMEYFDLKYGERYRKFKNFHMDRPFLSYVKIFDNGEKSKFYDKYTRIDFNGQSVYNRNIIREDRIGKDSINPSFKRMGLGEVLYLETARFLDTKNLFLHPSDCLSEDAVKMWTKLEKKGLLMDKLTGNKVEKVINPDFVDIEYPCNIDEIEYHYENIREKSKKYKKEISPFPL